MRRSRRRLEPARAVGVDTGGTFTDFVAVVGGRWRALKVLSTPRAPERAVIEGLRRLGATRGTPVRHGSTVATNALLERRGARLVFLTNMGFEDLLEIGRQERPDLYALAPRRTPPLVPRARRLGVPERRGPDGRAGVALTRGAIAAAIARARRLRPEAVAIGLLHAYANPSSERRLARAARALGVPVTTSSGLCPEIREYERFATTVVNAYLEPRVSRYLAGLRRVCGARLQIVLSHGGSAPARQAARQPARQLLSGPAAGLQAAHAVARRAGFDRVLTLDVGGTSTDVAFAAGSLPRRRARVIAGYPILLPLLDVHTVGAGGGSIAAVDEGGLLAVGPQSAGADPGPACYGRGGPATVTDALVVLGRLPDSLGDGAIPVDRTSSRRAMEELGVALGVRSPEAAAEAVLLVVHARMEEALRLVSVERGHDPRGAALVAFGGAGGLHACELAEALGVEAVVFPAHAGVLSALGALTGFECHERSRTVMIPARETEHLRRVVQRLERDALTAFRRPGVSEVHRTVLARYAGQSHELEIAFGPGLERRFHGEHRRRYGFAREGAEVEVVTIEVSARRAHPERIPGPRARSRSAAQPDGRVATWTGERRLMVAVWGFDALPALVRGPCVVLQAGATLWVPPRWSGRLDGQGALVLRHGGAR